MDWYDTIEEPVRNVVRLLRNNGINTISSCGHDMYIEVQWWDDSEITRIGTLLVEAGIQEFVIEASVEVRPGQPWNRLCVILFPRKDGTYYGRRLVSCPNEARGLLRPEREIGAQD